MTGSLLQGIVTCVVSWIVWKYFRQIITKSSLDNIPGPPSPSFLYGNIPQFLNRDGWTFLRYLIETYPGVAKLTGPLGHRILFVFDPTAIHNIIVKDQHIFEETAWFIKSMLLELGPGLLATLGERHRKQRKMLNPVFSIAHMRRIIPIFNEVGNRLTTAIESQVNKNVDAVELDIIVWMGRAALELIGQAGLGYSFDPLTSDAPDAFGTAIKAFQLPLTNYHLSLNINLMNHTARSGQAKTSLLRRLLPYIPDVGSPWFRGKVLDIIPHEGIHQVKSIASIMHARSTEIYEDKKRALEQGDEAVIRQIGEGKDIMSILLRENMGASQEDKLPEEELIGQMSTFILAAMDTTSNAIAVTLQLLTENPEVQERLRREILEASKGQDLDYDELISLPYLDAVCRETLRLHAPIANVFRETRADVVLPLSQSIKGIDGSMIKEIPIPKDTTVVVGLLASNCNKAIWGEDAMEWKPERWLSPLPDSVTAAKIPGIYSNLMTFLGGGRSCIGFKFSQLEMKVILCKLLAKFSFSPSDKQVVWNLSAIRFPTVGNETRPSLPMRVGLYKRVDPQ